MPAGILSLVSNRWSLDEKRKGFTLIELMVVIAIIAILSTVGFVSFTHAQISARDAKRKQDIRAVSLALELYYQKYHRYPSTKSDGTWEKSTDTTAPNFWLVDWGDGAKSAGTVNAFDTTYINTMPYDPTNSSSLLYQYFSVANTTWAPGNCTNGQYYILYANLENTNDPDSNSQKHYTYCGLAAGPSNGVGTYAFMVTPTP